MSKFFAPYRSTSNDIKVELDSSNYAKKDDVKNITHVDVSSYATKTNLAALKSKVDKIDTDKLKTVPADLAKLSNVVKNDVVKKTTYNTLKNKVDAFDTSKLTELTAVENKIPDVSGLATASALAAVENKIPDVSGLATASA